MGLTNAMYTGLTGLTVNQTRVETIGHNLANANTTAYKASRTLFQTQFSEILSRGTPPSATSGGTNPMQIGHGAMIATTHRILSGGSLETTGLPGDLAIEGAGYFVVQSPAGRTYYTRDGAFNLNSANRLVTADGYFVQGYGVDERFNVISGNLQPIEVPLGRQEIAHATENVVLDGDLSSAESPATQGSTHTSQALVDGGAAAATATTALTDLRDAAAPATVLFADGDTITVSGITRGGRAIAAQQFIVGTTGNTLGDFAAWLEDTLGIQTDDGLAGSPGVVIEGGALVIRGNAGEPNALDIRGSDIISSHAGEATPFEFTRTANATGTGVFTSFSVYDSLGNPVPVYATFTLESLPETGPVWRYYLESADPDSPRTLGTGTLTFNNDGEFVSASTDQFSLDRSGSGAATPLTFSIDFSHVNGLSTQVSNVIMAEQDGYPPGTLSSFTVGTDGTVTGVFSNGLTRTIGQIALATFTNEAGLVAETDNLFSTGPNSGEPRIAVPGMQGAGLVRGGALEMSNVDMSREFIGLITSSTGFQAASRVISTANEMLDQLLMTLR